MGPKAVACTGTFCLILASGCKTAATSNVEAQSSDTAAVDVPASYPAPNGPIPSFTLEQGGQINAVTIENMSSGNHLYNGPGLMRAFFPANIVADWQDKLDGKGRWQYHYAYLDNIKLRFDLTQPATDQDLLLKFNLCFEVTRGAFAQDHQTVDFREMQNIDFLYVDTNQDWLGGTTIKYQAIVHVHPNKGEPLAAQALVPRLEIRDSGTLTYPMVSLSVDLAGTTDGKWCNGYDSKVMTWFTVRSH